MPGGLEPDPMLLHATDRIHSNDETAISAVVHVAVLGCTG